jgi:DNA-binding FrmR family transcriptional regulator
MSALGSLVVKLALQHAEFTGGLDKSEQAALAASKRIQDTFDGMKSRIANTAGAIAGGLAAGFTIAAFKGIIQGSIDTGAALDDLRQQTGATGEALSAMLAIGKFNDVGPEQLGGAMNKLAANLAGATEESKGTGKALSALGLNMDELRKLKPEDQIQEIAKAMGGFEDGAGKSAVAMALFGKEGAKMIPFFNDLAAAGELQAKMTDEQIAASANLDDNLKRLAMSGDGWKKELANGMIPALDLGAQALLDVMNGTGGLREKIKGLAGDGSIKEWTNNAIIGFSYVADVVQGLMSLFPIMGKAIGAAMAATSEVVSSVYSAFQKIRGGDLGGAMTDLETGFSRVKTIGVEAGQDISEVWNQKLFGERMRERMAELETSTAGVGEAADKAAKPVLNFVNQTDKAAKSAAEAKDPVAALLDTISKRTAAFAGELAAGEKLTEGEKASIEVLEQLRTGKVKVTQAEAELIGVRLEAMLAAEQQLALQQQELKQLEAARSERLKLYQAAEQGVATLAAQNQSLSEEIELMGLSEEAQLAVIRGRNDRAIATKQATLAELELQSAVTGTMTREQIALQQEIELLKERNGLLGKKADVAAATKAVEAQNAAWLDMWNSVDRTAHDVFVDVANNGMSAFKRVGKTLQASVLDLLYQMTLRKWIFQILASVTGSVASGAAAAAGGSMGSSVLSNFGMSSLFSGLGSTISGAIGSAFGALFGTGVGNVALGTTLGLGASSSTAAALAAAQAGGASTAGIAGAGNLFSGIGAAMPWIAGIAALVSILGGLDDSGTYHTGGAARYSKEDGLSSGQDATDYNIGFGRVEKGAETVDAMGRLARGLAESLDAVATSFGRKAGFEIATAYADDAGSKDGAWGAFRISLDGKDLINWETDRQSKWAPREFADGEEGYKQYLAAIAKDTRQVLLDMDLASWADKLLSDLGETPTMEELTGVIAQINALRTTFEELGKSLVGFADYSDEAQFALVELSGGIDAFRANANAYYQNFYSAEEQRANLERQVRERLGKANIALPDYTADDARAQYRALIEAQDENTEEGRKAIAMLLEMSAAFSQLAQVGDTIASARSNLQDRLDALQGNDRAILDRQRKAEYDALMKLDPALAALVSQIYELEDAANIATARGSLQDRLDALKGNDRAILDRQRKAEYDALMKLDPALAALVSQIYELEDAAQAAADAERERQDYLDSLDRAYSALEASIDRQVQGLQTQLDSAQALAAAWTSVRDAAAQGKKQLLGMVQSTAAAQAAEGAEYIRQALAGALNGTAPDSQKLSEAISAATSGINQPGATRFERERAALVLAGRLGQLEAASGKQLTTAEQTVESLNRQIKLAQDTLDYWEEQIALANGNLDATLSVTEAIQVLTNLVRGNSGGSGSGAGGGGSGEGGGAVFGPGDGGGSAVAKYHRLVYGGTAGVGREAIRDQSMIARLDKLSPVYHSFDGTGDLVGLAGAMKAAGGTISDLSILSGNWESDWRKAFAAVGVPAFAKGGDHQGGWAMVGEDGPELAYMPPARIYNATQTRQLMSGMPDTNGGDFRAFLARLLKEFEGLRSDVQEVKDQTKRGADVLESAAEGPALRITPV